MDSSLRSWLTGVETGASAGLLTFLRTINVDKTNINETGGRRRDTPPWLRSAALLLAKQSSLFAA